MSHAFILHPLCVSVAVLVDVSTALESFLDSCHGGCVTSVVPQCLCLLTALDRKFLGALVCNFDARLQGAAIGF